MNCCEEESSRGLIFLDCYSVNCGPGNPGPEIQKLLRHNAVPGLFEQLA